MAILRLPKRNTKVVLTDFEMNLARDLANIRYNQNREKGNAKCIIGGDEPLEVETEGICGEIAFCKLFNLYFDPTQHVRKSKDNTDQGDCKLLEWRIDVKVTKYDNGSLITPHWKHVNVDIFALLTGTRPEYTYRGCMKSSDFLQENRLGELGRKSPTYIARQNELTDLKDLQLSFD